MPLKTILRQVPDAPTRPRNIISGTGVVRKILRKIVKLVPPRYPSPSNPFKTTEPGRSVCYRIFPESPCNARVP